MDEVKKDGRFKPGQSGNPRGRPPKRKTTHRTSAGYRATMLEVGAMPVQVKDKMTGETQEISLQRANMLSLGHKGASGHAPSAKLFLEKQAEAIGIHGELTELFRHLMQENARLTLTVERQAELLNRNGGVVNFEPSEEEWMRLAGVMEENWKSRKVSVEPKPR